MIIRVVGDTAPKFLFHIERDREPVNITGATITFRVQKPDLATVDKTCTITGATTGDCEATLAAGDTSQTGWHYGDLKIVFADATIQHARSRIPFYVRAAFTVPAI